ncbi:MAG: mannose-6-phosphate isomerase, class I, partial [Bacteroidota bacterium]
WVRRAAQQYGKDGHHDRGIFSIYWFNIVHLRPGQGIFQDAGIPHAYLEGVCVELMANSDNVLRGGLTPKHIDVPELLDKTDCSAVVPDLLTPVMQFGGWRRYATPAPDFSLSVGDAKAGDYLTVDTTEGPVILLLLRGGVTGPNGLQLSETARTVLVPAYRQFTMQVLEDTTLYLAEVGG